MGIKKKIEIGGETLSVEINKVATQANGSAWIQYGETVLLATATRRKEAKDDIDFLPLLVDYREHTFAAGKFPGGFFKREGKPSERETLTSRLIDRPLRPLFPENYHYDTQIVINVLSYDLENDPDVLGITAASAALYVSDIPFTDPIAGVRVGLIEGEFIINPKNSELENSKLNLVVAGTEEAIVMVESISEELSEEIMLDALEFAHEHIKKIVKFEKEIYEEVKPEKLVIEEAYPLTDEILEEVEKKIGRKIIDAFYVEGKQNSERAIDEVLKNLLEGLDEDEDREKIIVYKKAFSHIKQEKLRKEIIENKKRPDGRGFEDVRPLNIEVGVLPRTHGSSIFKRGETQALVTVTLGSFSDVQIIDNLVSEDVSKRFMLHYNFPGFSVGEVAPLRGPGRREIGHGNLAERALSASIPSEGEFPYTIRVVSEILESNGSSSMATVCGGCLSLMDAGVPVKMPIAGVAMGLIKENDEFAILTDIAGLEDHYGDMDFKVAGSKEGITALQMDIKIKGVSREIMEKALSQAKEGRLFILNKMLETISEPRKELSPYAPRISVFKISSNKIGDVIGPGGKIIKSITKDTGAQVNIEQDGSVTVVAPNKVSMEEAIGKIRDLAEEPEMGKIYTGKITRIETYGMFVEIIPGTLGLVHVSEIADAQVRDVHQYFRIGDTVKVKIIGIDEAGKVKLSRKIIDKELPEPIKGYTPNRYGHDNNRRNYRDRDNYRDRNSYHKKKYDR
jgi:polyribonucleotide nucleotidyltransferase